MGPAKFFFRFQTTKLLDWSTEHFKLIKTKFEHWQINCKPISPLICNLSILRQEVCWPASKTDPNTWSRAENWHTESLLYILQPCQISSHDESPVKRYWPLKLPSQIYLQENTSENNKLGLDLARKTGQMDTWEDENRDTHSLSWGHYGYAI